MKDVLVHKEPLKTRRQCANGKPKIRLSAFWRINDRLRVSGSCQTSPPFRPTTASGSAGIRVTGAGLLYSLVECRLWRSGIPTPSPSRLTLHLSSHVPGPLRGLADAADGLNRAARLNFRHQNSGDARLRVRKICFNSAKRYHRRLSLPQESPGFRMPLISLEDRYGIGASVTLGTGNCLGSRLECAQRTRHSVSGR